MVLLFELPICREPLGKKFFFAMWSLGRSAGAGGENSGELVAGLARKGRGKGVWATGARFAGLVGARSGRWGGHTGDGRRWPSRLPSAMGLRLGRATGGRVGGLAEVEKGLLWLAVGPQPELAAAALNGASGGSVGR
jgi:hypothetical protein